MCECVVPFSLLGHRGKAEAWSAMRRELEPGLVLARELPPAELVFLIGDLEILKTIALARIFAPSVPIDDRLIPVAELAERFHVSPDYVYRNKEKYRSFMRPQGNKLLFSSNGANEFLKSR